jgi:long-chain acyl-CoA synthetase
MRRVDAEEVATIVYKPSRGDPNDKNRQRRKSTPGGPSGCVITHANMVSSLAALAKELKEHGHVEFCEEDVHFSFTPLAHISERCVVLFAIQQGMSIGFASAVHHVYSDMQVLRPSLLVGSPRMFESLHSRFQQIRSTWGKIYSTCFDLAYTQKSRLLKKNVELSGDKPFSVRRLVALGASQFLDWFIFRRIARIMGGQIKYVLAFDKIIDPDVDEFVQTCFCCPVAHCLLFSEAGGFVALRTRGAVDAAPSRIAEQSPVPPTDANWTSFGVVNDSDNFGFPLSCNEMKLMDVPELGCVAAESQFDEMTSWRIISISDNSTVTRKERIWLGQGELCLRGPNVFKGYHGGHSRNNRRWVSKRMLNKHPFVAPTLEGLLPPQLSSLPSGPHPASLTGPDWFERGWWRTGRICKFGTDGTLYLIGSKRDVIRTIVSTELPEGGTEEEVHYIQLDRLEKMYTHCCDLIHQIWICGIPGTDDAVDAVDYKVDTTAVQEYELPLVAVVSVDHEQLFRFASELKLDIWDIPELCTLQEIQDEVLNSLRAIAEEKGLSHLEHVAGVHLVPYTFNPQNLLASPVFRLQRRTLIQHFHTVMSAKFKHLRKQKKGS